MNRLRSVLRDEEGLTLIELMISISILTVVILPVTVSFLLGLLETTGAHERIADSSSAQLISAYLLNDIQSSKTLTIDPASPTCPAPVAAGDDVLLEVTWVDPKIGTNHTVAYVRRAVDGDDRLYRSTCTTSPADTGEALLALNLDLFEATPACDITCTDPEAVIESVLVHVRAASANPQEQSSYEDFEFDIEATRRVTS